MDLFSTTFDKFYPGVSIHATSVANALGAGYLWRDILVRAIEISLMVLCSVLIGVLVPRLFPLLALVFGPLLFLGVCIFAQFLLADFSIWLHILPILVLIVGAHLFVLTARMIRGEKTTDGSSF